MSTPKVSIFFTRGTGKISGAIAYASAPLKFAYRKKLHDVPSHVGLRFERTNGAPVAAEAHINSGWALKPWGLIEDAKLADPKRRLWICPLPTMTENDVRELYRRSRDQEGKWDYAKTQLLALYLFSRTGIKPRRTYNVVCSEAVGRILGGFLDLKAISGVDRFDSITPFNLCEGLHKHGYTLEELDGNGSVERKGAA